MTDDRGRAVERTASTLHKEEMATTWQGLRNVVAAGGNGGAPSSSSGCRRWSGSEAVDSLFMDGWPRASVVEVVGGAGSGKTQLCMAVMVAAASTGATVLAIDTCNGFTHARLLDLAVAARSSGSGGGNALQRKASETSLLKDSQVADTLSRIHVARARDPWTLLDLLTHAADGPVPQQQPQSSHAPPSPKYDVVVVDCLHSAFAPYQHLQMDPAPGAGAGAAASADALASSAAVLFRRLAAQGCTVLVTNVPTPGGSRGARPAAGASALQRLHGPLAAALNDVFDAVLDASLLAAGPDGGPAVRLEVVTRPPYYVNQPPVALVPIAKMCTGTRRVAL